MFESFGQGPHHRPEGEGRFSSRRVYPLNVCNCLALVLQVALYVFSASFIYANWHGGQDRSAIPTRALSTRVMHLSARFVARRSRAMLLFQHFLPRFMFPCGFGLQPSLRAPCPHALPEQGALTPRFGQQLQNKYTTTYTTTTQQLHNNSQKLGLRAHVFSKKEIHVLFLKRGLLTLTQFL